MPRLVEHIDRHVPKRGTGPTVGTYLLVAILNRCVAPCSKASMAQWFQGTVLRRLIDVAPRQLSSQRFWDNMERVSHEAGQAIEGDVVAQMVRDFDIDLERVLFDATNLFTFIDIFNEHSTLAQRGHSKEGRKALRIVGLALLVSADFQVPLLHRTYPGNRHDAPTFNTLCTSLVTRYRALTEGAEHITLVFDEVSLRDCEQTLILGNLPSDLAMDRQTSGIQQAMIGIDYRVEGIDRHPLAHTLESRRALARTVCSHSFSGRQWTCRSWPATLITGPAHLDYCNALQ